MKNLALIGSLILSITVFFTSCKKVDGQATPPGFDSGPHLFTNKSTDTTLVSKTNGKWWFSQLTINGINVSLSDDNKTETKYYRREASRSSDSKLGDIYRIENSWFTVDKVDEKHIKVSLKENKDKNDRTFTITCDVGNASKQITVTQKAE